MTRFSATARMLRLASLSVFALSSGLGTLAHAAPAWEPTQLKDSSALKPPAGSKVAIVEFMDLECPVCAQLDPVVERAAAQHHVPWVHLDFPLPMHNWSFAAAVNARYFDSKSPATGNEYRAAVFANQNTIDNVNVLTTFTQKFAKDHGIDLPFMMDPGGKFDAEVRADRSLAQRMGVNRTPTIWVVAETPSGPTFQELLDRDALDSLIDQEQSKVGSTPAHSTVAKKQHGQ